MSDPKRLLAADPLSAGLGGKTHFAVAGQSSSGAPGDVRMYQWDSGVSPPMAGATCSLPVDVLKLTHRRIL